jgi:hypothetical protein
MPSGIMSFRAASLGGIECHSVLDFARPVLDTGEFSPFL